MREMLENDTAEKRGKLSSQEISRVGQVKRHTQIKRIHQLKIVNVLKGCSSKQNKSIINLVVLTCRRARIQNCSGSLSSIIGLSAMPQERAAWLVGNGAWD